MLAIVVCTQCGEVKSITHRSITLPFVCDSCQEQSKPSLEQEAKSFFESQSFSYDADDQCQTCAYGDCAGCEVEEPQEPMDEGAQLMFDMEQQIEQLKEELNVANADYDTMVETIKDGKARETALKNGLELVLKMLAKAFISLGEKEAEVLKAQDMEAASHTKLAEMMHERDEARKELAKWKDAVDAFNRSFLSTN